MIEVNNLTKRKVDKKFLNKIANKVLAFEKFKKGEVSIAFVSQLRIRELNKRYRKKNRTTDVLAFEGSDRKNNHKKDKFLGEVIISLSDVEKNSRKFKNSFKSELARILIHGILHLFGYDHVKNGEEAKMFKIQEKILKSLNSKKA